MVDLLGPPIYVLEKKYIRSLKTKNENWIWGMKYNWTTNDLKMKTIRTCQLNFRDPKI